MKFRQLSTKATWCGTNGTKADHYGWDPEGAFSAKPAFRVFFALELELATTPKSPQRSGDKLAEPEKKDTGLVSFLGRRVTQAEYGEICRNLREFFDLLAKWKEESGRT